jgi:hypothetical protein
MQNEGFPHFLLGSVSVFFVYKYEIQLCDKLWHVYAMIWYMRLMYETKNSKYVPYSTHPNCILYEYLTGVISIYY